MKPKNKDDVYYQEKLDELDGPIPSNLKFLVREAKRSIKRDRNKRRRNEEKRSLQKVFDDDSE